MIKEVKRNNQTVYACEACAFAYEEREWAEKCQEWCQKHQSCNIEIMANAIPFELETNL